MRIGLEIVYRIGLYALPIPWRSRIDVWQPRVCFVDRWSVSMVAARASLRGRGRRNARDRSGRLRVARRVVESRARAARSRTHIRLPPGGIARNVQRNATTTNRSGERAWRGRPSSRAQGLHQFVVDPQCEQRRRPHADEPALSSPAPELEHERGRHRGERAEQKPMRRDLRRLLFDQPRDLAFSVFGSDDWYARIRRAGD
jgi:hypothetical protein